MYGNPDRATLGRSLFAALKFHMNWLGGHYGWSTPGWGILWSLSIEEVFYLAFPLVCLIVRSEKILPWALLVLIVAGPINRVVYADLLYSDGGIPFGEVGRSLIAHFYNSKIKHGRVEAVYNCKALGSGEFYPEACVQDVERGVMSGINPRPWQTDTSNGDWFYADGYRYKTAPDVIRMLADIVSKNGNLLLNVVLYPDGSVPPESDTLLSELAHWMSVNAEAIHGTRPWSVFGEGPTEIASGAFKENADYTSQDIRFTKKGNALYAITLGEPGKRVAITSLGRSGQYESRTVQTVHLLGVARPLRFQQTDSALVIDSPASLPSRHASAFKIAFRA